MPEERRVVTVVFADVTGSTAMGEASDAEDVRAILGRYYEIAREVVAEHGGTLEKFIGDAVMAVFGIPQAHGDDADRALAATLTLRQRVAADPLTSALRLRIGVNTGEVVAARETAGGDFLVTGDPVNAAARLQQHAEEGAILVGERTRRAVAGAFRFGDEQRVSAKGKATPLVAATLLEQLQGRRTQRAPFLGRETDLAQLDLVARRAFIERRPQLVMITAPAGTGKSRLVEEFAARVGDEVNVATAQCLPYGAAVTFLPLRGLLRGLLRIPSDEGLFEALRAAFAAAGHNDEDAQRLCSIIGATLGDAQETERRDRDEIFAAWRLLIEVLAARGSLVVVFEDLHWASDTLLDLVEHVTTSHTATPLVMVALARPELHDRRPKWGGGRRNFTSLALEPLSTDEARRLVGVLTETVPGRIADRIVDRAGGNPFFVGELVRAYEDHRRAGTQDDAIVLPDTVHATVLARIDDLPASERSVLEYAAVVGRTARASAVGTLLPELEPRQIADALEALAERDLITPQGADAYTFRHIVIREVAYATLPRADRVRAHLRLARWLEEDAPAHGNELVELTAYHYRQAIALSPGGRVPEGLPVPTVVRALERAAQVASSGGAFREAREQLREAIRLAPAEEHLRLSELVGDLVRFSDSAVDGYAEAFDLWRASPGGDPQVGARLMVKRMNVLGRWSGSLSRPVDGDEFDKMAAVARQLLDSAPNEVLEAQLACARAFQSRAGLTESTVLADLVRDVESARRLYAERGDAEAESEALDALGAIYRSGYGDYERALGCARQRIANAPRLGLLERSDAWSVALWDLTLLGRYREAIATYQEARGALRAGEPEYILAHATTWATYCAMLCGRWDDVQSFADAVIAMREQGPDGIGRFTAPALIAATRVAAARLDATRLARYRSVFTAVADVGRLKPPTRLLWEAFIASDAKMAREYLLQPTGQRDRKAELIAMILFEVGERIPDSELDEIARQGVRDPAVMTLRIQAARALNRGAPELRDVIAAMDQGDLVSDAARAAALLAIRTGAAADRTDAERRLRALGDLLYLQRIAEELPAP
ncbi:MAG TPA: adenylate/guanylate cyclase domain-containing protein [Candidatus Limnocylindria bacterium]